MKGESMRKRIYTKICLLIIACIIFAPISLAKEEIQLIETAPLEKSKIILKKSLLNDKILLSSTEFDLRSRIDISVKNQKSTQGCWTFSSMTALETNLNLLKNEVFDFSERHMEYATSRYFKDGENLLGHNRTVGTGRKSINCNGLFYKWKRSNIRK